MKTHLRFLSGSLLALAAIALPALASDPPSLGLSPVRESLETASGPRTTGRLEGDASEGFRFVAEKSRHVTPLEPGVVINGPGLGPSTASGLPPFTVELGLGQHLSGRLASINDREIQLLSLNGEDRLTIARGGVLAVVQRAGESVVFQDDFESLDSSQWNVIGEPEIVAEPKVSGSRGLSLVAGGASLTHRLAKPFGSGRLEVAFHDNRAVVPGQQWFVDLTFRTANGQQTVRVLLGWAEDSLAVESSPGSPALAVQRLARKAGWHRLTIRFGPDLCEVGVDGNELAHGKGFDGPLVEVRLASFQAGKEGPPEDLAGHLDDLRLVRFDQPVTDIEADVTQDEIRLTGGDQLFGKIRTADAQQVGVTIDGRQISLSWGELSGLYLRRDPAQGSPVDGLLVRVDWLAASMPGKRELNSIEGALSGLSDSDLTVATPFAGTLVIPRARLATLRVLGKGRRILIDSKAHHLGDEISTMEPILDPPQPEGGVLERTVELPSLPQGSAFLVLDVVQVVGEATEVQFSSLVKKGELRTNVKINGEPFDYLNRYITSKNEAPERIRLPIPRGLLRAGRNVVRFEQAGIASDPNYLDDLGVLGIALEFSVASSPR